ncbi:MAG: tetratricopeptide repeat protein [Acidobacteriaceae bacterium]
MAAIDAGDGEAAKPVLEDLHARHPDNFEINESLGLLYAGTRDLASALPLLTKAASERPGSDAAAANLGIAYLKAGQNADSARELKRAVELNPKNLPAEEALGQVLMELGQPAKAAEAFHQALAGDGDNPTLLYNAALAYFDAGDAGRAAGLLARMPAADSSPEAQALLGDVEEKLGDFKSAGQHYLNAARLAPTEANEYAVGVEFLRHWTFPPAVAQFEGGVKRFPGSRRMRLALGIAYFGNHNYDKAIPVFAALLAAEPDSAAFADLLGRTCTVASEGVDPRCEPLIAFAEKHPKDAKAATYAAIHILHQPKSPDQQERARQLLVSATAADPNFAEAHYEMGLLLEMQEKWPQSIMHLERAVKLRPDYSAAHYRLALAYRRVGQKDKAQEEIALQQRFSAQEARDRDLKLEQIQTLLLTTK